MNLFLITLAWLLLFILLLFMLLRNKKDLNELENQLNQDYKRPHGHTSDKV